MRGEVKTWKVGAYLQYEIEAPSKEEAIRRLRECVLQDLAVRRCDMEDIAVVSAEKTGDLPWMFDYPPLN